jgi:H+/Cl- antiporter ClcA
MLLAIPTPILIILAALIVTGFLVHFAVRAIKDWWSPERRRIRELSWRAEFGQIMLLWAIIAVIGFLMGLLVTVMRGII